MSNLSELLPSGGGGGKVAEFTASGTLPDGSLVTLKTDGTVEVVSAETMSIDSTDDNGATQKSAYYGGACYHSGNNTIVISYPNSANSRYPTAAVCTVSGSTITIGTPTILKSGMTASMAKCAYDATQDKVVFFYAPQGTGYVKAATVSGDSFSFGSEQSVFNSYSLGNRAGDICNLDDSKVAICWGDGASGHAGVQAVSISGTSLTMGTAQAIPGGNSYDMRMASGKKGEFLVYVRNSSQLGYVAGTVSGTTITLGSVTALDGGSSSDSDVASGFWYGYTSPESTYIAIHKHPGGSTGDYRGMVITVSGTTLTLHTEISLTADPMGYTSLGWSNASNKALLYYRSQSNNSYGYVTELSYSGTTLTEGDVMTLGSGHYGYPDATFDHSTNKAIVMYQCSANSDFATVALITPSSTNAGDFAGASTAAYTNGQTATIALQGGISTNQTGLTAGSTYYVQPDGTLATSAGTPSVVAGKALSATTLLLKGI